MLVSYENRLSWLAHNMRHGGLLLRGLEGEIKGKRKRGCRRNNYFTQSRKDIRGVDLCGTEKNFREQAAVDR